MANRCIAVTGACGFLGRVVTERLLARGDLVYAVDALTYAADPTLPPTWDAQYPGGRFKFVGRDINHLGAWPDVDAVIHLAAETHVDNGNASSDRFMVTNILGTHHLLELTRARSQHGMPVFIHISTDEVIGEQVTGEADETAPLHPSSPYAASKAAAECLVVAWGRTYGLPYRIVRPSNVYGAHQYPEKLIPKAIRRMVLGQPMPIHGDGKAERSWLWVEDCADAILAILDRGRNGETYHVPGTSSASVEAVVLAIAAAFGERPRLAYGFDRPGLDRRYALLDGKLAALGWSPRGELMRDLPALVALERSLVRW